MTHQPLMPRAPSAPEIRDKLYLYGELYSELYSDAARPSIFVEK
jgi:hypothetical protein